MIQILRFEKTPVDAQWDSRARRTLSEIPVFFPEWRARVAEMRAISVELYWVRQTGGAKTAGAAKKLVSALTDEILGDPLYRVGCQMSALPSQARPGFRWWCLEKRLRPGVTDNAGQVLEEAVRLVLGQTTACRSGSRLWLELPQAVSAADVKRYASDVFFNGLIEKIDLWDEEAARAIDSQLFTHPEWVELDGPGGDGRRPHGDQAAVEMIDLREMPLKDLEKLSSDRLWALSKSELECVQAHYRRVGRFATDVEIEVIAQTWSEHCKHKIFAANIDVTNDREDIDLPARVKSVFKTYIRGATREIPASYLKSVFEDNAGVIAITSELDCAIKVETHNSPSALDPYGGALTGIVGVNRDILGVGLGAQPIANLDVFCVGPLDAPDAPGALPPRLHHPRRILEGVRLGVEHGGNKSGIPTVTGAIVHHPGYLGKPLVFCGTIGIIPAGAATVPSATAAGLTAHAPRDLIKKEILPGDKIVMAGGRIGKDGIHGATFSSLEMNESSPVSAVQLGDPLTQRRVWDFLLEARDRGLFRAVTDNGAGGLSSSIGELARLCGKKGGARMDVAHARTKYPGLKPYELVVSESQERMSFAVQPEKVEAFLELALSRGVECSVLGEFDDTGRFDILYDGKTVGELDMEFLHEGLPPMELKARVRKPTVRRPALRYGEWKSIGGEARPSVSGGAQARRAEATAETGPSARRLDEITLEEALPLVLALPNVRSRRDVVRQYDHEVQARSVRKPYGTPGHLAPGDGATLRLSRTTHEGVAVGLGLAPFAAEIDPKVAAELALDEALRNACVAGMDPSHAALVDNFCWPDPVPAKGELPDDAEAKLGALVVTCRRIYEGAVELRMPFISGKDSMKNDYRMKGPDGSPIKISVPPTLLITAMGKVQDVRRAPQGAVIAPKEGEEPKRLLWISGQEIVPNALGLPVVDFRKTYEFLGVFHRLLREGLIESAHDVGDGGWLTATAELLFGAAATAELELSIADFRPGEPLWAALFGEPATSFVLSVRAEHADVVLQAFENFTALDVGRVRAATQEPGDSVESGTLEARVRLQRPGGEQQLHAAWNLAELERAYHSSGGQP